MAGYSLPWPLKLVPRASMFHPETVSRSGGLSLTGREQITASGAGRWRARLDLDLRKEEAVLSLRALVAQLEGRAGTVLVPKWEMYAPKAANGRRFNQITAAPYDGGVLNFDLSGWGQGEMTHAELAAPAARGATQISVTMLDGAGPRPGQYFGIGGRLYLVAARWRVTEDSPVQIRFWPRFREAATTGERVILDRPVCLMRLADDASGELTLELLRWGSTSLDFVEVV
ncbi:MAG TPA: hypothetical protein VGU45_05005 [Microvirga sp.]|jgi:hypothetical protein|nr:hypothetical protein [Microvirga sp.]